MNYILQPWHLLLTILAGLINRQQQEGDRLPPRREPTVEGAHGKRRIRLTDDSVGVWLSGKALGPKGPERNRHQLHGTIAILTQGFPYHSIPYQRPRPAVFPALRRGEVHARRCWIASWSAAIPSQE